MGTKMKSFSKRSTFFVQFFTLACFFSAGLKRKQYYVILCIIKHSFRSMSTLYQISFVKVNILPKHSLTKVQLSVFYIFKLLINTILQIFQRDRKIWNERGKKPYILLTIYVRNVGREKFDKIWQNTKLYQHWQNNNPLPRPPQPLAPQFLRFVHHVCLQSTSPLSLGQALEEEGTKDVCPLSVSVT